MAMGFSGGMNNSRQAVGAIMLLHVIPVNNTVFFE